MTDINTSKKNILIRNESQRPNKKQKMRQQNDTIYDPDGEIHAHDILCGRDHFAHNHEGNAHYRKLVKSYKMEYVSGTKQEKKQCSHNIYNKIRELDPPGRFLKFDSNASKWKDIGEKEAIIKICQALREGAPSLRDSLKEPHEMKSIDYSNAKESRKEEANIQLTSSDVANVIAEDIRAQPPWPYTISNNLVRQVCNLNHQTPEIIPSNVETQSESLNGNTNANIQSYHSTTSDAFTEYFRGTLTQPRQPYIISKHLPLVSIREVFDHNYQTPDIITSNETQSEVDTGNTNSNTSSRIVPKRYF